MLTGILRGGDLVIPRGDTVLEPEDAVLAVVHASEAERLSGLLGPPAAR